MKTWREGRILSQTNGVTAGTLIVITARKGSSPPSPFMSAYPVPLLNPLLTLPSPCSLSPLPCLPQPFYSLTFSSNPLSHPLLQSPLPPSPPIPSPTLISNPSSYLLRTPRTAAPPTHPACTPRTAARTPLDWCWSPGCRHLREEDTVDGCE